jgi:transposase
LAGTGDEALRAAIEEKNDATLEELRMQLAAKGIHVSVVSIWRALAGLGLTLKKNSARHGT